MPMSNEDLFANFNTVIFKKILRLFLFLKSPHTVANFQKLCGILPAIDIGDNTRTGGDKDNVKGSESTNAHKDHPKDYLINNTFLYYLFRFGASLGNEIFFITFFPFWFWNVDGYVGRLMCTFLALFMYLGQAAKDVIRLPRPLSPPVYRLEQFYALEYGMPSTHAMMGAGIPFTLWLLTVDRYIYPIWIGFLACTIWCALVCTSRIYLGMHTLWDVTVGLVFVFILMAACMPFLNAVDDFILTSPWSPLVSVLVPVTLALLYPSGGRWSTAQGDTTLILAAASGVALGHWVSYQYGFMQKAIIPPPYEIIYPSWHWFWLIIARTIIGILILVVTRTVYKKITYSIACWLSGLDPSNPLSKQQFVVELPNKFITYSAVAFNAVLIAPMVFRYFEIERETFFMEI